MTRWMTLLLPLAMLPALLVVTAPARAWSADGHRIVGHLAEAELTPMAKREVATLLAGEEDPTLAGVSTWADRLRDDDPDRGKATAPWHYVNFRGGDCVYDHARDCAGNDCVIGAINRQFLALADKRRPLLERREALKFLVHFVGDVHQPMHASPRDDLGGNRHQVNYRGKGSNLHRIWDGTILEGRGLLPEAYAAALRAQSPLPADPTARSQSPAVEWALESCRVVQVPGVYPPRRVLDDAYLDAQRPVAEARLREAGRRLAAMLNHALRG